MSDLYYYNTVLLLHGDGADASTTATDSSNAPHTLTAVGNAQLDTAQSKFGTASLLFDGTGDYFTTPDSADWDFGTGDFTVETWARFSSHTTIQTLLSNYLNAGTGWVFQRRSDTNILNFGNGDASLISASWTPSDNTWYHLVACRAGGVLRLFVDGAQIGTSASDTTDISGSTTTLLVGTLSAASQPFAGWLDDLRITKGVGRYSANFTPPTEAHPDAGETAIGTATLSAPAPTLAAYGGATAQLTAPIGALAAYTGGSAELTAPSPTLEGAFGAHVSLVGPSPTLYAVGHDATGENSFEGQAPGPSLAAFGGANAALRAPAPTLEADGTGTAIGSASLTAPRPTLSASGMGGGVGSASMRAPMATLVGYFGGVASVTIGGATLEATGTGGAVGVASLRAPLFELVASGTQQAYGYANLIAPSPRMGTTGQAWLIAPMARLVAIGTAVVTATYEAYSLNLKHQGQKDPVDELTRYTNFPFTHVVRYRNSYFGVAADGLYLLEGTTDYDAAAPTEIPWAFKTAMTDFGSPARKALVAAYFAGRMGPSMVVTMYEGDTNPVPYDYDVRLDAAARNYRQRFGLGSDAVYYAVGAAGSQELSLDAIEFDIAKLSRRI
jgi:hypothetical protein